MVKILVGKCCHFVPLRGGVALIAVSCIVFTALVMTNTLFVMDTSVWKNMVGLNGSIETNGSINKHYSSKVTELSDKEEKNNCTNEEQNGFCADKYDEYLAAVPTIVAFINVFAAICLIGASDTGWRTGSGLCFKTKENPFLLIPFLITSPVAVFFLALVSPFYVTLLTIPMLTYSHLIIISYYVEVREKQKNDPSSGEDNRFRWLSGSDEWYD